MKNKQFISVVLTISDKNEDILKLIRYIGDSLCLVFDKFEIIIVDNASGNIGIKTLESVTDIKGDKVIIKLPWSHRKEHAIQAGLDSAIGDFVYEIQHTRIDYETNIFKDLFDETKKGYDIVSAVPDSISFSHRIFYKILNIFSHLPFALGTETIILSSRRALNSALKHKQRTWQRKIMYKFSGYDMSTITFHLKNNTHSHEAMSEKIRLALDLIFSFTNLGFAIPMFLAGVFMMVSVAIGLYTVYAYIFFSSIVEGWTTQMLFLSFAFSGIFFILGFMSRYMGIILAEVHQSSNYTVKSINHIEQ